MAFFLPSYLYDLFGVFHGLLLGNMFLRDRVDRESPRKTPSRKLDRIRRGIISGCFDTSPPSVGCGIKFAPDTYRTRVGMCARTRRKRKTVMRFGARGKRIADVGKGKKTKNIGVESGERAKRRVEY